MSFESIDWDESETTYVDVVTCHAVGSMPDGTEVGMSASLLSRQDAPEARESVENSLRALLGVRYVGVADVEFIWQPDRLPF